MRRDSNRLIKVTAIRPRQIRINLRSARRQFDLSHEAGTKREHLSQQLVSMRFDSAPRQIESGGKDMKHAGATHTIKSNRAKFLFAMTIAAIALSSSLAQARVRTTSSEDPNDRFTRAGQVYHAAKRDGLNCAKAAAGNHTQAAQIADGRTATSRGQSNGREVTR